MIILKRFLPYLLILVFAFFAFKPLLAPGFFPIHDNTQVARVYEMTQGLKDGMFPVRWSKDLGYGFGYPIFNYYDPLLYYAGGFVSILGADALSATKLMVILGILLSGFSMYLFAKEFWGKWGGILSSVLYVFAPFHAVDIFVRGDFAESFAYAFIPFVFYGLWKTYKQKKWKYVVISSFSYAAVIVSHNLYALMISPFIVLFVIFLIFKDKKINKKISLLLILSIILGILISAFYSFPAILEMKYTNILSQVGGGADYKDHFVCLLQLWTSPWGYGGSAKGCIDGLSFMIGKYHIIFSFLALVITVLTLFNRKISNKFREEKEKLLIVILFFIFLLFSAFLTLEISRPVWDLLSFMAFLQYPWRFLAVIGFFTSFISGFLVWFVSFLTKNEKYTYACGILISIFIVLVSIKFFAPQSILKTTAGDYTNSYALNFTSSKISDEYMPMDFNKPNEPTEVANFNSLNSRDLMITSITKKTQLINIDYTAGKNLQTVIPLAYFPAWKASLDGENIDIRQSARGILVNLISGKHTLNLVFVQTGVEKLGNLISIIGISFLFLGIIHFKRKYD